MSDSKAEIKEGISIPSSAETLNKWVKSKQFTKRNFFMSQVIEFKININRHYDYLTSRSQFRKIGKNKAHLYYGVIEFHL
jgi:hypothetical protein